MISDILMIDSLYHNSMIQKLNTAKALQVSEEDIKKMTMANILTKQGNKALINIDGAIIYGASIIEKMLLGAVDTLDIMNAVKDVYNDKKIDTVVFAINSPGGSAMKIHQLADMVFQLSQVKNVASVNTGTMASGAYYFGSQASHVFSDDELNRTGSIGTKVILYDRSKAFEKQGVKVIPIATGELKAALEEGIEIDSEQIEYVKEVVNELQEKFNDAVMRARMQSDMSDGSEARSGKTFSFEKANQLGLVDSIKTVEEAFIYLDNIKRVQQLKR